MSEEGLLWTVENSCVATNFHSGSHLPLIIIVSPRNEVGSSSQLSRLFCIFSTDVAMLEYIILFLFNFPLRRSSSNNLICLNFWNVNETSIDILRRWNALPLDQNILSFFIRIPVIFCSNSNNLMLKVAVIKRIGIFKSVQLFEFEWSSSLLNIDFRRDMNDGRNDMANWTNRCTSSKQIIFSDPFNSIFSNNSFHIFFCKHSGDVKMKKMRLLFDVLL